MPRHGPKGSAGTGADPPACKCRPSHQEARAAQQRQQQLGCNRPGTERNAYHVSEDLVDQAIAMITAQQSSAPGSKFFTYLAFGATHSPHQAPTRYIEKYEGRYDDGWDAVRQRWFDNQLAAGIVPEGTTLAPRNPGVKAWDELSGFCQRVQAVQTLPRSTAPATGPVSRPTAPP